MSGYFERLPAHRMRRQRRRQTIVLWVVLGALAAICLVPGQTNPLAPGRQLAAQDGIIAPIG